MRLDGLSWYRLRWPREVEPEQIMQVCRLLASVGGQPIIIEAVGSPGLVEHRLALPASRAANVVDQFRAAIPGLSIDAANERPALSVTHAAELRLSTQRRPLRTDDPTNVSRAIVTALADLHHGEHLSLQWVLARSVPAMAVPNRMVDLNRESWVGALLLAPFSAPQQVDAELRNALRAKHGEPGWRAAGRIGVTAATASRARQLVAQVVGALGTAAAPGVGFSVRPTSAKRLIGGTVGWRLPLRLNVSELASVSAFPVGMTGELPVSMIGSRLVAPAAAIRDRGRVIGRATYPGRERPVALTPTDSLRHLHVLGPTGVGKSTLLINMTVQDMQAGRAVVVIDPKGDLITDLLARIPAERVNDVVVLDPVDEQPVGLNPLALHGRSPELVADQLLGMFHALYAANWGPRTHDILGASLLTLARTPGMTLASLPVLLTSESFRRRIVAGAADPIALGPFWATYESWSEQQRAVATAPTMNKLRPLLMRPELRAVIGQSRPRFDLHQVFTERKILLCSLSKGQLGPETAALLGSIVVSMLWQVILGRGGIAPERRHPVFIVVDEFQDYVRLPLDFADALAQARGLGAGFALTHQHMHQLEPAMRSSVLANAQSRVAFRLPAEDARVIASGSTLAPEDFQSLGAFECYAQLVADGAVQPWCSAMTLPAGTPVSDPATIRAASRQAYGIERAAVEAEMRHLFVGGAQTAVDDLTPRRRDGGGSDE